MHKKVSSDEQLSIEYVEEQPLQKFHWKIVFTAGMGFFTDAYDLFIIGIVTALLIPVWHLSTLQLAVLNGAALMSAAVGAISFGYLSDHFGRKKIYGLEVLILIIGAILSACAFSFTSLLIARIIVGFGIGGDYPSSAVVATEHANRKNRGFLVLLVFAMQALGLVVGPLFAAALLSLGLSLDTTWRTLFAFGAIPAMTVFYLRRRITESPHFTHMKRSITQVSRVIHELHKPDQNLKPRPPKVRITDSPWLRYLIGTAGAWFLLDVAFYGNGISSVLIMENMVPNASLLSNTLLSALLFLCFAVPGYACAAKYVDKVGRRNLQILGFIVMAICYSIIGLFSNMREHFAIFVALYGLSYFFVNFGPNSTTFLIPAEIYPTAIRARAHGISAAVGKVGAFVGAFFMPIALRYLGFSAVMLMTASVSILGILTTILLPEMKAKGLSSIE